MRFTNGKSPLSKIEFNEKILPDFDPSWFEFVKSCLLDVTKAPVDGLVA